MRLGKTRADKQKTLEGLEDGKRYRFRGKNGLDLEGEWVGYILWDDDELVFEIDNVKDLGSGKFDGVGKFWFEVDSLLEYEAA